MCVWGGIRSFNSLAILVADVFFDDVKRDLSQLKIIRAE